MENKMYDLMEKMYKDFLEFKQTTEANMATKDDVNGLKGDIIRLEQRMDSLEVKVDSLERTVLRIEHDHGEKLSALFDGYEQNSQKLDRIEQEVAKHEEFIIKRVK
ncbi:MAG: hypothetical protein GX923_06770 [Clostridia bacterium]|nr:hypothetical protein [Clostridia bacterium]